MKATYGLFSLSISSVSQMTKGITRKMPPSILLSGTVLLIAGLMTLYFRRHGQSVYTEELLDRYDYIVVGAGTAGSVLASRLSEDGNTSVLLLEAGGSDEDNLFINIPLAAFNLQQTEADWSFYTTPQKHSCFAMNDQRSVWPKGRIIGGTGSINGMAHIRGSRHDYNNWAAEGCEGWGYKDVLPYFLKSEDIHIDGLRDSAYHSTGGPMIITEPSPTDMTDIYLDVAREMGYPIVDWNAKDLYGYSKIQATIYEGERWSTARAYLRPAMKRNNLHVSINSMITKIIFEGKTAVGIDVIKNNRKFTVFARKEVILSAGAVNSPHLLMVSGIGHKEHLKKHGIKVVADLPVGDNLQDHMVIPWIRFINQSLTIVPDTAGSVWNVAKYLLFGTGPLSSIGMDGSAFLYDDISLPYKDRQPPDIHILFFSTTIGGIARNVLNVNFRKDVMESWFGLTDSHGESFVISVILAHPKSRGTIRLKSRDPFDYPEIDPNYLAEPDDVRLFLRAMRMAENITSTKTLQKLGTSATYVFPGYQLCLDNEFRSDAFWECYIRHFASTAYHTTSTCRMGLPDDPTSVVDPLLRVKGIANLRVVDASVMRNVPTTNTNAPAIMIAEKAADLIRGVDTVQHWREKTRHLMNS